MAFKHLLLRLLLILLAVNLALPGIECDTSDEEDIGPCGSCSIEECSEDSEDEASEDCEEADPCEAGLTCENEICVGEETYFDEAGDCRVYAEEAGDDEVTEDEDTSASTTEDGGGFLCASETTEQEECTAFVLLDSQNTMITAGNYIEGNLDFLFCVGYSRLELRFEYFNGASWITPTVSGIGTIFDYNKDSVVQTYFRTDEFSDAQLSSYRYSAAVDEIRIRALIYRANGDFLARSDALDLTLPASVTE